MTARKKERMQARKNASKKEKKSIACFSDCLLTLTCTPASCSSVSIVQLQIHSIFQCNLHTGAGGKLKLRVIHYHFIIYFYSQLLHCSLCLSSYHRGIIIRGYVDTRMQKCEIFGWFASLNNTGKCFALEGCVCVYHHVSWGGRGVGLQMFCLHVIKISFFSSSLNCMQVLHNVCLSYHNIRCLLQM